MKSKLGKYLSKEVGNGYKLFLNGELKKTTDEVREYGSKYDDCNDNGECLRNDRKSLKEKIDKLYENINFDSDSIRDKWVFSSQ